MGIQADAHAIHVDEFPQPPEVDGALYRAWAAANAMNADLNETPAGYLKSRELTGKRDSLYTAIQFAQLLSYLSTGRHLPRLHGVVYATGGVALPAGRALWIIDGTLITEGTVQISRGASLEIVHSAATRTLPGLIAVNRGALAISPQARLRVHGLVFTDQVIDLSEGARMDITGSVLSNDAKTSLLNFAASVVIRYDPAVWARPVCVCLMGFQWLRGWRPGRNCRESIRTLLRRG